MSLSVISLNIVYPWRFSGLAKERAACLKAFILSEARVDRSTVTWSRLCVSVKPCCRISSESWAISFWYITLGDYELHPSKPPKLGAYRGSFVLLRNDWRHLSTPGQFLTIGTTNQCPIQNNSSGILISAARHTANTVMPSLWQKLFFLPATAMTCLRRFYVPGWNFYPLQPLPLCIWAFDEINQAKHLRSLDLNLSCMSLRRCSCFLYLVVPPLLKKNFLWF